MIITCYRVNSGFANMADGIALTKPGYDQSYTELNLILPEGYTVGETVAGLPVVCDDKGAACELCLNSPKGQVVLAVSNNGMVGLKRAPEKKESIPLQKARLAAGLTQKQLAEASGVNSRQIQRVEEGQSEAGNLTAKNLLSLADALGIDPRKLI